MIVKELLKSISFIFVLFDVVVFGCLISLENWENRLFFILISLVGCSIYVILLKDDLEEMKNDYDYDIDECNKKYKKKLNETISDLANRGMAIGSDRVNLENEIKNDWRDYKKYRTNKFKIDFRRAKYLVFIKLLKARR